MQHVTPSPRRRSTLWTALLAVCVVIVSPIVGVTVAHAVDPGYQGQASGTSGTWADDFLGLMTKGVAYSDTIQAPQGGSYDWSVDGLPAGLGYSGDGDILTISGTPTVDGAFDFTVNVDGGDGASWHLEFIGTIDSGVVLAPTTTTLEPVDASAYYPLQLMASVAGTGLTGKVQFYANGSPIGDPQDVYAGNVAYYSGSGIENSSLVGSRATFTARYLGDETNAPSTSDPITTFIYQQGDVFGYVYDNGSPVAGATVDLLLAPATASETPEYTTTTDSTGLFLFNIQPTTQVNAEKYYVIRATLSDDTALYYNDDAYIGTQNYTDIADADTTGPLTWENRNFSLYRNVPPTWSDDAIADFAVGSSYSDAVEIATTGVDFKDQWGNVVQPNVLQYNVTAGSLPDGISLDTDTGAITGTPQNDDPYDFTVTANDIYGSITKEFSGTPRPAGVAPTWSDDVIGSLQQGVALADGVSATGDPTIVYSVSAGTLPDGLALDADTGAIAGTPTVEGEFDFTVKAQNDFGNVTQRFTGTIAAAPAQPDLGLTLDFVPGSSIDDASTTIQASGLMVGSTYTLVLHSTPVTLYVGTVDATGGFSLPVALPAGIPAGSHSLVLTGVAPDGSVLISTGWFSIDADGRILQISMTGPIAAALASTGTDATPGLLFGGSLLLAGLLFFAVRRVASRRRAVRRS